MEYRLDSSSSWIAISGKTLSLKKSAKPDRDVLVYVRMKATATASASFPIEFTIPRAATASVLLEELDKVEVTDKLNPPDDSAQTETPIEPEQPEETENQDKTTGADTMVKDELNDGEVSIDEEDREPPFKEPEEAESGENSSISDENSENIETPVEEE